MAEPNEKQKAKAAEIIAASSDKDEAGDLTFDLGILAESIVTALADEREAAVIAERAFCVQAAEDWEPLTCLQFDEKYGEAVYGIDVFSVALAAIKVQLNAE